MVQGSCVEKDLYHFDVCRPYQCYQWVSKGSASLELASADPTRYDGSMMNGLQTLPAWQDHFDHPKGGKIGILNAIMAVGSITAIPFVPYAADLLGRRTGILVGCIIMLIGVVLQSISAGFGMFLGARFLLGFGVAIAHGASPLLITELVHPQHRAIFTTIYNTTWYAGSIVAAWLTYGTNHIENNWSWRIPTIAQALPSCIQIACIWFVPESPRWYIAHGKEEKGLAILAKVHANGNEHDEMVQTEYVEIRDTLRMEKEAEGNGWLELVKTKGNRHRLIILLSAGLFSQWSGNGLVSYYINKVSIHSPCRLSCLASPNLLQILNEIGYTDTLTQNLINGVS